MEPRFPERSSQARQALSRPRKHYRWLHIPKTGSAFINLVARYACPSLVGSNITFVTALNFTRWRSMRSPQTIPVSSDDATCAGLLPPWAGHIPVREHERDQRLLLGIFRAPSQRLISGFHHTEYSMPQSMIAPGMPREQRATLQHAAIGDPARYAQWPGIASCTTKMLLGWPCASSRHVSSADVERAIRVLDRFAFVGLLEHWVVSVCVFHVRPTRTWHPCSP